MKIGPTSTPAADAATLARANAQAGAAASSAKARQDAAASPAGSGDASRVSLSSAAGLIAASAAHDADFDAAKVERIRNAIGAGTYTVDAGAIADKLIANAQELLAAAKR